MAIRWTTTKKIIGEGLEIRDGDIAQREQNVLTNEARESYLSMRAAVKGDLAAEKWLANHKHLWFGNHQRPKR